jgi:hypothetical protein
MITMLEWIPVLKLAGVALVSDMAERKLIRSGRPGQVVLVKIATYVTCVFIAYVEWRHLFRVAGAMFGVTGMW